MTRKETMMSMRKITSAAAVATAVALVLVGCAGGSEGPTEADPDAPVSLTYASFGGTFQDAQIAAFQEPYTAENPNVTFENTSPADPAKIKAQVEAGITTWDIADVPPYFAAQQCGILVEELELDIDESQFDPATIGDCFIGAYQFATILVYNTETYTGSVPTSINDYFDTSGFPGQRGIVSVPQNGLIEYALLADGVSKDELYPLDVDRALSKWDTVRDDTTFASNNGALFQLIVDGQVDMALIVSSRAVAAIDAGATFKPVWDTTVLNFGAFVVPKGSTDKAAAEKFISFAVQPAQSQKFAELSSTTPVNLEADPQFSETGEMLNAFGPANDGTNITIDSTWWGDNFSETAAKLTTWLNG